MKAVYAVKSIQNRTGKSESFIHFEDANGLPHFIEIKASQFDKIKKIQSQAGVKTTTTKGDTFKRVYIDMLQG